MQTIKPCKPYGFSMNHFTSGKQIITPLKKSFSNTIRTISSIIKINKSFTQEKVFLKLYNCIRDWTNYYKPISAKCTFAELNAVLWDMLWKWAKCRHQNKGHIWIKNKYWKTLNSRTCVFKTNKIVMINPSDVHIVRHDSIHLKKNHFLDKEYFVVRRNNKRRRNSNAYYQTLLPRFSLVKECISGVTMKESCTVFGGMGFSEKTCLFDRKIQ